MNIEKGETKTIQTAKFGTVTISMVSDSQLNVKWYQGKFEEKGFLDVVNGNCTVPQNVLMEISSAL